MASPYFWKGFSNSISGIGKGIGTYVQESQKQEKADAAQKAAEEKQKQEQQRIADLYKQSNLPVSSYVKTYDEATADIKNRQASMERQATATAAEEKQKQEQQRKEEEEQRAAREYQRGVAEGSNILEPNKAASDLTLFNRPSPTPETLPVTKEAIAGASARKSILPGPEQPKYREYGGNLYEEGKFDEPILKKTDAEKEANFNAMKLGDDTILVLNERGEEIRRFDADKVNQINSADISAINAQIDYVIENPLSSEKVQKVLNLLLPEKVDIFALPTGGVFFKMENETYSATDFKAIYRALFSGRLAKSSQGAGQGQQAGGIPRISTEAEYLRLPKGTVYIDPNGVKRTKP